jgi:hypothetical protein
MPPKRVLTASIRAAVKEAKRKRPLASAVTLLAIVKVTEPTTTLTLVKEVLAETPSAAVEIAASRKVSRYDYDTIRSKEFGRLVGDLVDFSRQAYFNKTRATENDRGTAGGGSEEFKYAVTVQDIRSRFVWMVPIEKKAWEHLQPAMLTIFREVARRHRPISLTFDSEPGIAGGAMKDWLAAGADGTINPNNFTLFIVDKERHGPSQVRTLDAFHRWARPILTEKYWNVADREEWAVPYPPYNPTTRVRETARPLDPPADFVRSQFQLVVDEKNDAVVSTTGFTPKELWEGGMAQCLDGSAPSAAGYCLTKQEVTTAKHGYCTTGKSCSPVKRQGALRKYKVEDKFAVGDRVRMLQRRKPFEKATATPNWSREVYRINIIPRMRQNPGDAAEIPPPLTDDQLWNILNGVPNDATTFQGNVPQPSGVSPTRSRRIEIENLADATDRKQVLHWEIAKALGAGVAPASTAGAQRKQQKRAMGQEGIDAASGRLKAKKQTTTRAQANPHDLRSRAG